MKQYNKRSPQSLMRRTWASSTCCLLLVILTVTPVQAQNDAAEKLMAQAFDAVTETPFASIALGILETGAHSQSDPEVLDKRLQAVEAALTSLNQRLKLVEQRLTAVENEVAHQANIQRLRKLEQVTTELAEITAELRTKPTSPVATGILEFRARQQADLLKNDPDFDIWKLTDVTADGVRTRFFVYPTFETYVLALLTWFSAIQTALPPQPTVAGIGQTLSAHEAFLETRTGFVDQVDAPISLLENLDTAAFCRLEAVDKFSNNSGACVFAAVCIDTMNETSTETERLTINVEPPVAGTLCTTNPGQSIGLKGEDDLRRTFG